MNGIKFIHINYSADIENKFIQKHFLFHGSSISSWYPIVKNGLKVMSGTAMMANGAKYGNGIYFSDQFNMSYGYSRTEITNGICVVGVFEVLEDPEKYKKTTRIYVISNDKIVLLRSLILVSPGSQIPKDISNYFLKKLPTLKQINQININMLKNKRLEGEYKKLSSLDFIDQINIVDQFKWMIDFKHIKGFTPSIEIIFSNYPLNPPIIKSSNNKIKIGKLVGSNGNINIDLVNPSNWKITNTLGEICTILYKCFQESL
jgi:ubiquitin-protein ligase